MVDEFEKVALDCLSNSFLRKAGLVVIDEVERPSMLILHISIVIRLGLTLSTQKSLMPGCGGSSETGRVRRGR